MIYRKRIRKTGYGVSLLRQHVKVEFGKRVLYLPFDIGIGKPFGSLRALFDTRRGEFVVHNRRRDMVTVPRDPWMMDFMRAFNAATSRYSQT